MKGMPWNVVVALLTLVPIYALGQTDWPSYGHDPGGMRYSPLTQITPANVTSLRRAWTFETGEPAGSYQVTPLVVDNMMYISTPAQRIVALNAETGEEIWSYDPEVGRSGTQRGVTYWPGNSQHGPRIFFSVRDGRLIALDAGTGAPVPSFGQDGVIDLRVGVADNFPDANYYISSPPAIYHDLIILGPRTGESTPDAKGPAGDIRAFSTVTGDLVWSFNTLPRPGEPGYETWGPDYWVDGAGPSAWAGITVDVERGLVFVPTGQPTGGGPPENRIGINLYANCLLALDAETGELRWYFQVVHHDQWDFDVPAPPALIDVVKDGQRIPAVAQLSKQGMLFILDRTTGEPLFGVEERAVPAGVSGDGKWPTQPFPVKPAPLARNTMTPAEVSTISPQASEYCAAAMNGQTLVPYMDRGPAFPSSVGGGNWGGVAFDPERALIFVNTSEMGRAPDSSLPNRTNSNRFVDPDFYPCNQPPWGLLHAIDANTGDPVWRVPLGSYKELEAQGITNTGTPNLGGAIATASGLVFIGATNDERFRAFDAATGKELWVEDMNAHAMAVPITYEVPNGNQFVVVATGGTGLLRAVGSREIAAKSYTGTIVAFALPQVDSGVSVTTAISSD